jgi:hypothetical protein
LGWGRLVLKQVEPCGIQEHVQVADKIRRAVGAREYRVDGRGKRATFRAAILSQSMTVAKWVGHVVSLLVVVVVVTGCRMAAPQPGAADRPPS